MTRRYDSRALRDSARGQDCTLNIPGVCNYDPATVVLCHAPSEFKGMGMKSPDWWAAFGCARCHDILDRRVKLLDGEYISNDSARFVWMRGITRTQDYWFRVGLLTVGARYKGAA